MICTSCVKFSYINVNIFILKLKDEESESQTVRKMLVALFPLVDKKGPTT